MLEFRDRLADRYDKPVLLLEVTRGNTRHPVRPVVSDRFLIGASAACDLRLGGETIPPLHSLIVRETDGRFRWERVSAAGDLICNGRPVESQLLDHGDRVRIGPMELIVRLKPGTAAHGSSRSSQRAEDMDEASATEDPAELTASELVDRLEREFDLVERFDSRRQLGAESLLEAVANAAVDPAEEQPVRLHTAQNDLRGQLVRLAEQLNTFAGQLDAAQETAAEDEAGIAESMALVLDAERRLNGRMASLLHPDHPAHPAAGVEPAESLTAA